VTAYQMCFPEVWSRGDGGALTITKSPGVGLIRRLGKETRPAGLCMASRPFQQMALL